MLLSLVVRSLFFFCFSFSSPFAAGLDELTTMMKEQGTSLSSSKLTDRVERAKSKLYASYQKNKERRPEEHILEKEMAHHVIPTVVCQPSSGL